MNRISKQLLKIAREINATEYDDFKRLTQGFDKKNKQYPLRDEHSSEIIIKLNTL